ICDLLGNPSDDDLKSIEGASSKAVEYVQKRKPAVRRPWNVLLPNVNPVALDLISKLLQFNPKKRLTVQEALTHPYVKKWRSAKMEAVRVGPVDISFEIVINTPKFRNLSSFSNKDQR